MAKTTQTLAILVIAGAAYIAGRAGLGTDTAAYGAQQQQDTKEPPKQPAMTPTQQEMMALAQPGEAHKPLELLLGDWEGELKVWFAPGSPPMTFKASKKRESFFDKRYVMDHSEGSSDMGVFHGLGILGYNNYEKRYEALWIDDGGTAMSTATGTFDADTKTFTYTNDEIDMSGKKVKNRMTIDCSSADKQIIAGFRPGPDGKEYKAFEGMFSRKK